MSISAEDRDRGILTGFLLQITDIPQNKTGWDNDPRIQALRYEGADTFLAFMTMTEEDLMNLTIDPLVPGGARQPLPT